MDELRQVRELIEKQRSLVVMITQKVDSPPIESALARIWLLGCVESALWRIERHLGGDTFPS